MTDAQFIQCGLSFSAGGLLALFAYTRGHAEGRREMMAETLGLLQAALKVSAEPKP